MRERKKKKSGMLGGKGTDRVKKGRPQEQLKRGYVNEIEKRVS